MRIQVSYFTYYLVTYWLLFLIVFFCVLVGGIIIQLLVESKVFIEKDYYVLNELNRNV